MTKGIFIIGTDTGVGKTAFAAGLMYRLLRSGCRAGYYKPVASGEIEMGNQSVPNDATFVKIVSGYGEEDKTITPFSFKAALSPHFASRLEEKRIDPNLIKMRLMDLKQKYDCLIVEGCGGLAVPLNDDGWMLYDLIRYLGLGCFLVARSGLGTINHTLMTLHMATDLGIMIKGIFMNGYSGSAIERDNIETLKKITGHPSIFPVPAISGLDVEHLEMGNLKAVFDRSLDLENIVNLMENF